MTKPNFENKPNQVQDQSWNNEDKAWNQLDKGEKILASSAIAGTIFGLCLIVNNAFTQYPAPRELECTEVMMPASTTKTKTILCTRQNYTQEFISKDLLGNPYDNVNDALLQANQATSAIVDSVKLSPDGYNISLETPLDFDVKAFEERLTREIHVSNL